MAADEASFKPVTGEVLKHSLVAAMDRGNRDAALTRLRTLYAYERYCQLGRHSDAARGVSTVTSTIDLATTRNGDDRSS